MEWLKSRLHTIVAVCLVGLNLENHDPVQELGNSLAYVLSGSKEGSVVYRSWEVPCCDVGVYAYQIGTPSKRDGHVSSIPIEALRQALRK